MDGNLKVEDNRVVKWVVRIGVVNKESGMLQANERLRYETELPPKRGDDTRLYVRARTSSPLTLPSQYYMGVKLALQTECLPALLFRGDLQRHG